MTEGDETAWWRPPVLAEVWSVLGDRLERRGLVLEGRVVLRDLERPARHALADLLGREVGRGAVSIDLGDLDERLRRRAGLGLVEACAAVTGTRLVDRRSAAATRREQSAAPGIAVRGWLAAHPEADWAWVDPWMGRLRSTGLLGRDDDPASTVVTALEVLWNRRHPLAVPGDGAATARTDLAAVVCHDAHALDDDRRLAGYVLRAVAVARDRPFAKDAAGRRDLWAEIGVLPDSVSSTCLVWHLPMCSFDDDGRPWRPDTSWPFHVTWWQVRAALRVDGVKRVLVCENPRVLEAAAEADVPDLAVVCTSGRPNLTTQHVLSVLASSRARLHYHGDFDWPGVAMANEAVRRWGARPLRMAVSDYESAPGALRLSGQPVEPVWDAELGAAMRRRGVAVHEEAVLDELLSSVV